MRKRIQKKSEVLREGYIKGLRKAQRIINEMMYQSQGFVDDIDDFSGSGTVSGEKYAVDEVNLDSELIKAAEQGNLGRVKSLLERGANVNATNMAGETPLHWAAVKGNMAICKLLLRNDARINVKDEDGWTPRDWAEDNGQTEVCELLTVRRF